jgi:outer membrane protein OmpA-like peptidoglycan-associated protein
MLSVGLVRGRFRTLQFVAVCSFILGLTNCGDAVRNYEAQGTLSQPSLNYTNASDLKRRFDHLATGSPKANPNVFEYLVKKADVPALEADESVIRIVFEERVFFDTARWDVRRDASPILQTVATALKKDSVPTTLFVAGYTDGRGGDSYNLDLSVKRADSVAQALLRLGIGNTKIWRVGFGKSAPLKPNDSAENMALNRRVEFIVSGKQEAVSYWLSKQCDFLTSAATDNVPELCKTQSQSNDSFQAVEVHTPPIQQQQTAIKPTDSTNATIAQPQTLQITLQPPVIQNVGRPSR